MELWSLYLFFFKELSISSQVSFWSVQDSFFFFSYIYLVLFSALVARDFNLLLILKKWVVVETDLCIDFEEIEEEDDDELRTEYQCPYCTDDFDLVELCSHVDEEHYLEAKSGVFYFTILLCISPFDLLRSCLILIACWATL